MAAVTICSNFGAQKNKVCHCFHCFPIYLPWSDGTGCHDLSFLNFVFFFPFFISWRLITLQYCSSFDMNQPWIYMYSPSLSPFPPPSLPNPSGSSQYTRPEHLSHASNLGWWSVSPLIIHMFQCCSLKTSHPRLLSQSPKVCSVHLCLFFCFTYRVIITIFLNSIFMH